eukprot:TRINITY_DN7959_c0_g1_i1.p1 TRINITY_DN7959_c0_g1~~TRINITY_DN7959_c0_g1_i1.p1  ORF type:complete len:739 (-),score=199.32 TRINITY_DN7959_c0_g1_i1:66-2282(-)
MWSEQFYGEDVETLQKILPPDEQLNRGWIVVFINPSDQEQDRVMMLSSKALYRVKFKFGTSKIYRYEKIMLSDIQFIEKGYYELDEDPYYCFRIHFSVSSSSSSTAQGNELNTMKNRTYRPYDTSTAIDMVNTIVNTIARTKTQWMNENNIQGSDIQIIEVPQLSSNSKSSVPIFTKAHNVLKLGRQKRISKALSSVMAVHQSIRDSQYSPMERDPNRAKTWNSPNMDQFNFDEEDINLKGSFSSTSIDDALDSSSIEPLKGEPETEDKQNVTRQLLHLREASSITIWILNEITKRVSTLDDIGFFVVSSIIAYGIGFGDFSVLWVVGVLCFLWKIENNKNVKRRRIRNRDEKQIDPLSEVEVDEHHIAENGLWFNIMFKELWRYIVKDIASVSRSKIIDLVQTKMNTNPPPGVESIQIKEVAFGPIPPIISQIVATEQQGIDTRLDFRIDYFGPAFVTLDVTMRVPFLGLVKIPIVIDQIDIQGKVRLDITFFQKPPYIHTITSSFLDMPEIMASIKPLNTFDLMCIPWVREYILSVIKSTLISSAIFPETISVPYHRMFSVSSSATPEMIRDKLGVTNTKQENVTRHTIAVEKSMKEGDYGGVLHCRILEARKLTGELMPPQSMPYCVLSTGPHEVFTTNSVKRSKNPTWNEFFEFLVLKNREKKVLEITVLARDSGHGDHFLGQASMDFSNYKTEMHDVWIPIKRMDRKKEMTFAGEVRLVVRYLPSEKSSLSAT